MEYGRRYVTPSLCEIDSGYAGRFAPSRRVHREVAGLQPFPPNLMEETLNVAKRCGFSLDELKYQYPQGVVPVGETPESYLRRVTYEGSGRRWPQGMTAKVQRQIEHELALICELKYEQYFLTVYDIVAFARSRGILCQGRGSAANSTVCYCFGVTEVDPARMSMLFERFISKERNEPPDIDIDFEHERREEVIPDDVFSALFQVAWSTVEAANDLFSLQEKIDAIGHSRIGQHTYTIGDAQRKYLQARGYEGSLRVLSRAMLDIRAACYIVVASLSGCRNHEIAYIRNNACRKIIDDEGNPYWWMHSRSTKTGEGACEWLV